MNSNRSFDAIMWLLNRFGCTESAEAILGDLIERCRNGESRSWYFQQIAIVLILSFRGVLLGFAAGTIAGATAIVQNNRGDGRTISFFPDAVTPTVLALVIYLTIRYWRRSGVTTVSIRRGLRQAALGAAIVMTMSHFVFAQLRFGNRIPFEVRLQMILPIAGFGFVSVAALVMLSGWLATKLSKPGHYSTGFPLEPER